MLLGLSQLREHKLKHSFQDFFDPICTCWYETETTNHYLLHFPIYTNERMTLLNNIRNINTNILDQNDTITTKDLLFSNFSLDGNWNTLILNGTTEYLISTKRFDASIFAQ